MVRDAVLGGRQFREEVAALVPRAAAAAAARGAPAVEAEHLLLAMAAGRFGRATQALQDLGLSPATTGAALDREQTAALALVGVDVMGLPGPRPVPDPRRLRWGQSARLAAERSTREEHPDPRLRMLLAIVHAQAGVVPRLLAELDLTVADVEAAVAAR